ncbi:hypothetical protein BHE74_00008304 [Ensete ventricosum]|nr:hypothetical protein GW17_00027531 [Ensete ventricosum]RWW83197.1 hypothetical protein BHE74_00008304 [Ensete ventricosum]RZR92886.1 hypothetical protein BHM03_00021262 [Ensete ventricosum]
MKGVDVEDEIWSRDRAFLVRGQGHELLQRQERDHVVSFILMEPRFEISSCTARYRWYISIRQFVDTWTARYRTVPPNIDHRRSISTVDGRLRENRLSTVARALSLPTGRPRTVAARTHGRFFSRARRKIKATGMHCAYRSVPVPFRYRQNVDTLVWTVNQSLNRVDLFYIVPKTKGASRHIHLISEKHLTEELRLLNLRRRSWDPKALAWDKRT